MSSKKKPLTIDVTGLSVKSILEMDVSNFGEDDLRAVSNRLASAMNKRIKRLKNDPVGEYSHHTDKHFSVKGLKRPQLLKLFKNMRNFAQSETGSVTKFKEYRKKITDIIGNEIPLDDEKNFWRLLRKVTESGSGLPLRSRKPSDPIINMLADIYVKTSVKHHTEAYKMKKMTEALDKLYEQEQSAHIMEDNNDENEKLFDIFEQSDDFFEGGNW